MRIFRLSSSVASLKKFAEKPPALPTPPPDYSIPRRHPIKMNSTSAEVIPYTIPNRPLTPLFELPLESRVQIFPYFASPPNSKIVSVAIIGAPNSGKSSLLNSLLGERFFSVSRKLNTTTKLQEGYKTTEDTQITYFDTPGIISTHSMFTDKISTSGWECIEGADLTLFVVDAVKMLQNDVKSACARLQKLLAGKGKKSMPEARISGETDEQYESRMKFAPVTIPASLVVNKVDLVNDRRSVKFLVNELKEYAKFTNEFFVSAEKNYNVDQIEKYVISMASEGQWSHNPLQKTSLTDVEIAAEVVREQVMNWVHDELPYRWIYQTIGWTPFLDGSLRIDVDILVKTNVHKAILIGKESRIIKRIAHESEVILSKLYQRKITLVINAKLMNNEVRKAVYKGKVVEISHPRLPHKESLSQTTMKQLGINN